MSDKVRGVAAALALAFIFSIIGVFARELDVGFTLFQQVYVRIGLAFLLAAAVFAPFVNWRKELRAPLREWALVALRGLFMYVGVIFHTYGLLNANYGTVAFLTVLPIFPLIGYVVFRERVTVRMWAYIALAMCGALLVGVHDWSTLSFGTGELAVLVAILFFDFAYVARRWQGNELSNAGMATGMFFFGALAVLLGSVILGEGVPQSGLFTPWVLVVLLGAALLNVAHVVLSNYTFSKLSVTLAGTLLMLESVFGLGVSILLYSEYPTTLGLIGAALILFSVYKVNHLA